jgi:hypothetical protein
MSLNRSKVEAYVKEHWFTPCDDGVIYSYVKGTVHVEAERKRLQKQGLLPGSGWQAVLLPELDAKNEVVMGKERGCFIRRNPLGQEIIAGTKPPELSGKFDIVPFYQVAGDHDGLVDCAHYVSRCLTAGDVSMNQPGVPGLVQQIRARHDTRTLGLEVTLDSGQLVMDTGVMKFGDIIAYVHEDPKTHQRGYAHSAIYTGFDENEKVHRISCHTVARFNEFFFDTWWNITVQPDWRFTLIHFADDVFPPLARSKFEVVQGGKREVYDLQPHGRVVRAQGTASAHKPLGALPQDHGYWFVRGFKLFVFWPRSGQVAEIRVFDTTPDTDVGFPITLDGLPATMLPASF